MALRLEFVKKAQATSSFVKLWEFDKAAMMARRNVAG